MLRIPAALLAEIKAHAGAGYPHETCGILIGRREGAARAAVETRRAGNLNVDRARDRYLMDPKDQLAAEKYARAQNLEIVGYYHSHPDHPARPSATDNAQSWENISYLILSVDKGLPRDAASFSRQASQSELISEELEITP
jgi:proteasome lid subunit RPN8/RPN11